MLLQIGLLASAPVCHAQIVYDSSLGTAPLTAPNYLIPASAGKTVGNNLFHSFDKFNVRTTESARFTGPASIQNIINRVTGNTASVIDGRIESRSAMPNANFFLLNPNGVMFGPNATLDVGGSFHVSTADYLRLADEAKFFAKLTGASTFSAAAPAAFGFLSQDPVRITVDGSSLRVTPGHTLSVVGGEAPFPGDTERGLKISGPFQVTPEGIPLPTLGAPGALIGGQVRGGVQVISVASAPGEVSITNPDLTSFPRFGQIDIVQNALLDTSGEPGGSLIIRGRQLTVDNSFLSVCFVGGCTDVAASPRPAIDLQMTEMITLRNQTQVVTASSGAGRGGDALIAADQVHIEGATISTLTSGNGDAGDIALTGKSVTLSAGAVVNSQSSGGGRSGNLLLSAGESISISASGVLTDSSSGGAGGSITVLTRALTMDEGATIASTTSAISTTSNVGGGDINVRVDQLNMAGGGTIRSGSSSTAHGGDINVTVTGSATIAGLGPDLAASGIFATSSGAVDPTIPNSGRTGDIVVNSGRLELTGGALISSGTPLDPQGGNISITGGSITISDGSGVSSQSRTLPVGQVAITATNLVIDNGFINTSTLENQRGGDISLAANTLSLLNGGQVVSSNLIDATGRGGDISIKADSVTISGISPNGSPLPEFLRPFFKEANSGIFSTASSTNPAAGSAGSIILSTPRLTLTDGGKLSVATIGAGPAGTLSLDIGAMTVTGGALVDSSTSSSGNGGSIIVRAGSISLLGSESGLISTTSSQDPTAGAAGSISVTTPTLVMNDGGKISVATTGAGNAGIASLKVGNLSIASGARVDSSTSGAGQGGTVDLNASSLTITGAGSGLFSTAQGSGSGGDIKVTANQGQLLDGATISASSTGTASALAGNVNIVTNDLSVNKASITTDSLSADGGNISITTAGSRLYFLDGKTTTSVRADEGQGGNITFGSPDHPIDFIILNGSQIRADAFGGPGGNIRIFADTFLTDRSVLSASSALSAPGTINVQARFTNLSGNIAQLPATVVQAAELLRAACAARLAAGKSSSLVVAGREGIPLEPGGVMPSPLIAESPTDLGPSRSDGHEWETLPAAWRVSLRSKCSM